MTRRISRTSGNGWQSGRTPPGATPLLAGLVFAGLLAGCVSGGDVDAVRRDVAGLRQEMASLVKAQESSRVFTDERLTKLETDFRGRFEASVKETEGSRTALVTRLDDLATETRLVQGKLEENAFALTNLNNRLDEIDQAARQAAGRVEGLDQQVKGITQKIQTLEQQVRMLSQPGAPPAAQLPGQLPGGWPAFPQAFPGQPPLTQPSPSPPTSAAPPAAPQPPPGQPPVTTPFSQPQGTAPVSPPSVPAPPPTATPAAPAAPPVVATRPPQPPPVLQPPEDVYRAALNDYTRGNYDLAISGFRTYIENYPKTSLVPNAQYWLGESYYGQRNYAQAIDEFEVVIRDYPDSPKVPSALFKQGDALLQMGDTSRATAVLCELIAKHGKTREARLARDRNIRCR